MENLIYGSQHLGINASQWKSDGELQMDSYPQEAASTLPLIESCPATPQGPALSHWNKKKSTIINSRKQSPFTTLTLHPSLPPSPSHLPHPTQNCKRPHPPGPSVPRPCRSWRFSWRYCPWTRPRPPARAVAWAAAAWAPRHAPRPGPTALPGTGKGGICGGIWWWTWMFDEKFLVELKGQMCYTLLYNCCKWVGWKMFHMTRKHF